CAAGEQPQPTGRGTGAVPGVGSGASPRRAARTARRRHRRWRLRRPGPDRCARAAGGGVRGGLAGRPTPCGPGLDRAAAERVRARLAADGAGSAAGAWDALAPIFGASPYLARLAVREGEGLASLLAADPQHSLAAILDDAEAAGGLEVEAGGAQLRRL